MEIQSPLEVTLNNRKFHTHALLHVSGNLISQRSENKALKLRGNENNMLTFVAVPIRMARADGAMVLRNAVNQTIAFWVIKQL